MKRESWDAQPFMNVCIIHGHKTHIKMKSVIFGHRVEHGKSRSKMVQQKNFILAYYLSIAILKLITMVNQHYTNVQVESKRSKEWKKSIPIIFHSQMSSRIKNICSSNQKTTGLMNFMGLCTNVHTQEALSSKHMKRSLWSQGSKFGWMVVSLIMSKKCVTLRCLTVVQHVACKATVALQWQIA